MKSDGELYQSLDVLPGRIRARQTAPETFEGLMGVKKPGAVEEVESGFEV